MQPNPKTVPVDAPKAPRRFVFVLLDNFTLVSFSAAVDSLRIANRMSGLTLYEWKLAGEPEDGRVACSAGAVFQTDMGLDELNRDDTLVICGGADVQRATTKKLLNWLRREARRGLKIGGLWFVIPTFLQFAWGLWWLLTLDREVMLPLMGGDLPNTLVFMLSIFLPIGALVMVAMSLKSERPFGMVHGASWLLLLTVVGMVITRHAVREYTLQPYYDVNTAQTLPQWGVFGIFAALLVVAIAITAWMVAAIMRAPKAEVG